MSTAVITGCNRGIGLSLARLLSAQGLHVIATCRRPSPELQALPVEIYEDIDVTNLDSLQRLKTALQGRSLDWLLCNAGVYQTTEWDSMSWESVEYQWQVNTLGVLKTVHTLQPLCTDGATIGLLSSRFGSLARVQSGGYYGYRMSKAALNMAGVCLAEELRPLGISVALLHPGYVRTEMNEGRGELTVEESAERLWDNLKQVTLENSGQFWNIDGSRLPW